MLKTYFKIAWRNISKSRSYAAVNIVGLSVGIAFLLLIGGYVWREYHVNHDLKNADNQYIIQSIWKGRDQFDLTTVGALAKSLKEQYPHLVQSYYRWDGISDNVSKNGKNFRENIQIGDSTLLTMYGFGLLYGNPATAFNSQYNAVIKQKTAIKYFGRTDVLGETLSIENFSGSRHDFVITGVLKDLPFNSVTYINQDNNNDIFLPDNAVSFFGRTIDSWANPWIVGYVELKPGVNPKEVESLMRLQVARNTPLGIKDQMTPILVPIKDYYLLASKGYMKKTLSILSIIAVFIMFMAIVNFINIAISKASARMKEIGVRKVLGGMRRQLIAQFLSESLLMVMLSTVLALGLYLLFTAAFNKLLNTEIPSLIDYPLYAYGILIGIILLVGLLAGIYPALVLSALKPVDAVKSKIHSVKENILLRKYLVGFQFSIATIVLIGAFMISKQVNYFLTADLGFDKSYILSAQVPRDWTQTGVDHLEAIRNEFAKMPEVESVSLSYELPDGNMGDVPNAYKPGEDSTKARSVNMFKADANYLSTLKVPLIAGTNYGPANGGSDSSRIVVNESVVSLFGWKDAQHAIGQRLALQGFNGQQLTIIGVVKDFQIGFMQGDIPPSIFTNLNFMKQFRFMSFRIRPGAISHSIQSIQSKWTSLMPSAPFEYRFMDERIESLYSGEIQLKQAAYVATILASIIVLLGVLGLVSLSIEKRRKEIGIRKVLGSSVSGIIYLFIREFLLIILFAGLVACPLAYYIIQKWLEEYANRVSFNAVPFLVAMIGLGLVTGVLIVLQAMRAAGEKVVGALKGE